MEKCNKSSKSTKYRLKAKKIDKMLGGLKKTIYFYNSKSIKVKL
jgi:hypothetical protein